MGQDRAFTHHLGEPRDEDKLAKFHGEFETLQTEITKRLKPKQRVVVFTSDSNDPAKGYDLTVDKRGVWAIVHGKEIYGVVNSPFTKKVYLHKLLRVYVFLQNSLLYNEIIEGYFGKNGDLIKSVSDNPVPFAESFLGHMTNTLGQLSA